MMKLINVVFIFLSAYLIFSSQEIYGQDVVLKGKIQNRTSDTFLLAQVYGDNQFVVDTAEYLGKDVFEFRLMDSSFHRGIYYIIALPGKEYFQLLVDDRSGFSFVVSEDNVVQSIRFKDAPQNERFYEYMRFLEVLKKEHAEALQHPLEIEKEIELNRKFEKRIRKYQNALVENEKGSLLALLIGNARNVLVPDFKDAENPDLKRYRYFKQHYFDHMDLVDERNIYTPNFFPKIDEYINKYTIQHPDSIVQSMDRIFDLIENNEPGLRFIAAKYLNKYAKSKLMGMDKVYVFIADRCYGSGKASWLTDEQRLKIVDNANFYRQNLIGMPAPALGLLTKHGERISVHALDSKYTLLLFWSPTCSHCKAEMPKLKQLTEKLNGYGVTFVTICTKTEKDCWKYLDSQKLEGDWIDAVPSSQFYRAYDVRSTPKIYLLDDNKEIIFKNMPLDKLPEIFEHLKKIEKTISSPSTE